MDKLICKHCDREFTTASGRGVHEVYCKSGPNPKIAKGYTKGRAPWNKGLTKETSESLKRAGQTLRKRYENGELVPSQLGKQQTDEHRQKISKAMKVAHKEGRAWNIGKSRWNNEPSWPEKFFMQVIENEFADKEYEREYSVSIYSCDFAWPHKKKCIEIDGSQHQRFKDVKERDKRKDEKLSAEGWEVLRIPWTEFFHDTKHWIELSNNFIGV